MGKRVIEELFSGPTPDVLYHYTTQEGLLGILEKRALWATHTQYLNDTSELSHALGLIRAQVVIRGNAFDERLTEILQDMNLWLNLPLTDLSIFVASFSKVGDSLTQWRAYGGPTSAFAIGFDGNALREQARKHQFHMAGCIYSQHEQEDVSRRLVDDILEDKIRRIEGGNTQAPEFNFAESLIRCAPVFKSAHYSSEEEWRLISLPLSVKDSGFGCRPGRSMLIPYYSLPLEGTTALSSVIKKIVVGPTPHPEKSQKSLKRLLENRGLDRCEIFQSDAPYRNW